jgi:hypothetical protein
MQQTIIKDQAYQSIPMHRLIVIKETCTPCIMAIFIIVFKMSLSFLLPFLPVYGYVRNKPHWQLLYQLRYLFFFKWCVLPWFQP